MRLERLERLAFTSVLAVEQEGDSAMLFRWRHGHSFDQAHFTLLSYLLKVSQVKYIEFQEARGEGNKRNYKSNGPLRSNGSVRVKRNKTVWEESEVIPPSRHRALKTQAESWPQFSSPHHLLHQSGSHSVSRPLLTCHVKLRNAFKQDQNVL